VIVTSQNAARAVAVHRHRAALVGLPAFAVGEQTAAAASEAGFGGARIAAQGPARASVTIDSARPQAAFGWLAQLEGSGLVVERLHARANSDRTLLVEASLRARRR